MATNYEITRNQMRGEFVKYDQENMIRKFSLRNDASYIYINKLHLHKFYVKGVQDRSENRCGGVVGK